MAKRASPKKYDPETSFLIKNPNLGKSSHTLKTERLSRESVRPIHLVHDHNVQRYRENKTDKCLTEIAAAHNRADIQFGTKEHQEIKRTCSSESCSAKYHWCPTCFLAPRCDCMMPHMSPSIVPSDLHLKTVWSPDQSYLILHIKQLVCDNRYGTFVQSVRSIAQHSEYVSSPFCIECTKNLRACSWEIGRVSGRTYLEQASNLWKIIGSIVCDHCINIIDRFPCMHLGTKCPSTYLKLICTRLKNYQPRRTIEKSKTSFDAHRKVKDTILYNTSTSSGQIFASRESTSVSSIRETIRSSMKSDTSFSRAPGVHLDDRRSYLTTDICTSNPPWMSADIRNVRSEAWMHFWQSPNDPIQNLTDTEESLIPSSQTSTTHLNNDTDDAV